MPDEIIITGKSNATGNERAILSAAGENKNVLEIYSGIFRFENIEISGARINWDGGAEQFSRTGYGINIGYTHWRLSFGLSGGRQITPKITLGQGAIVRNNSHGIGIGENHTLIITGGETRDNGINGIITTGILTIERGSINNNASNGIVINSKGKATMINGTITRNGTNGVVVKTDGSFIQTGGTINTNGSSDTSNVSREEGALGTNL
jgi:hypothetical protein